MFTLAKVKKGAGLALAACATMLAAGAMATPPTPITPPGLDDFGITTAVIVTTITVPAAGFGAIVLIKLAKRMVGSWLRG